MSRKCVRNIRVYARKWSAVILCSLIAQASQSAHAAADNRAAIKELRSILQSDRRAARQNVRRDFSNQNADTALSANRVVPIAVSLHASARERRHEHPNNARSMQLVDGEKIELVRGIDLDLTSTDSSITLGEKLFGAVQSIEIKVGDTSKTVAAGSDVTSAEYVAAKQILSSGTQEIVIARDGGAIGGSVNLEGLSDGKHTMKADDLVVPAAVTAYGSLTRGSDFQLRGDLTNFGTVNITSNNSRSTVRFAARDILNADGSVILSETNLELQTRGTLTNHGTIAVNGNLTLAAGEKISNTGSLTASSALNIDSPVVSNSGHIASTLGNVTIDNSQLTSLSIDNTDGSITADNAINIRNRHYNAPFDTRLAGGDLFSKQVNLFTGNGVTDVKVRELTGQVNSRGTGVHVSAQTDELIIGNQKLDGDPTYFNLGKILITGDIVVGERLAILSNGNITSTAGLTRIVARSAGGVGQEITIVSGVDMTTSAGAVGTGDVPSGSPLALGETVRVIGNSPTGGTIDFEASPGLQILTNGTGSNHAGAHVNLLAFRTCP
ncbi:MAG: hypothetical protein K2X93_14285 [Candidatus Obscuribacterales bacterium]|nr:hypothetical protein [Candidatus Obscuribacterales bacterium]